MGHYPGIDKPSAVSGALPSRSVWGALAGRADPIKGYSAWPHRRGKILFRVAGAVCNSETIDHIGGTRTTPPVDFECIPTLPGRPFFLIALSLSCD